ncbi:outer membrane protein [Lutibacter sp. Hel_I_33_5]|uniref:TolC family protein n=1 Tax=Lutibacter sp. Hel_I_33_5 TaxID=1566289 RepID=UPI00119E7150|nr:TolC family protein [Lutibacter sp. Hel_I_33_5]TVZ56611.1 outer membrane protein [Lutibacter sp. Hel_I_33_5]
MKTKIIVLIALLSVTFGYSQKKWTLKECVDTALKNNLTIKQNKLNLDIAEQDVKSADGNFLPTVSASTSGNLGFGSTFDPVSNNRISTTNYGGSVGVRAGYTVFSGFRNLNLQKQAELGVESSKLNLETIQNDISLRVVNSYLNVLFAKENLNVANVQYEISQKQIEAAQKRFDAGAIPKGDLLNVQSTAASDAQNVVTFENTLNIALLNLAQSLQVPFEGFDVASLNVGTPSANLLYNNSNIVYQKALDTRPEIKKAEIDIESAGLGVEIAKSAYMPTVTASGSIGSNYGYSFDLPAGVSNTALFTQLDNNLGYGLGFNVSIPIFNGFRTDASVSRSKINRDIVINSLETQKLQLQQLIEQAFLDSKAAAKSYEVAQISLESQKEAFKNAQERYTLGAMTLFDFDQVRNRYVNAQGAMIRAKYDYVFKSKVLQFYYGDLQLD